MFSVKKLFIILISLSIFLLPPALLAINEMNRNQSVIAGEQSLECQNIKRLYNPKTINIILDLFENIDLYLYKNYMNLGVRPGVRAKIPRIIHHIWLTNAVQRREISEKDLPGIINAKKINDHGWRHIVWTNDKTLIPKSVQVLAANDIEVRELSEIADHLKLRELEDKFIEKGLWGMASDTLRYDIVNYMGGVYTDIDYEFKRSVEEEICKYDFFGTVPLDRHLLENYFFGSIPNHPILDKALEMIGSNCSSEFMISLTEENIKNKKFVRDNTDSRTYFVFVLSYYLMANHHNNTDVVYPSVGLGSSPNMDLCHDPENENNIVTKIKKCGITDEKYFKIINKGAVFHRNLVIHDMCGSERFYIGSEREGAAVALTWAK